MSKPGFFLESLRHLLHISLSRHHTKTHSTRVCLDIYYCAKMPQQETDTFLLLIEEFCSPHIIITNHHIQLGELILDGYSNDSLTLTSTYESNQVASTCLHCLMTPTIHSTEDSIVYLKILSVLLPVVSVRHSLFNPESILIPVLFHSITHQPDPTDFIFETFAIFVKLLLDHPTEVSKSLSPFSHSIYHTLRIKYSRDRCSDTISLILIVMYGVTCAPSRICIYSSPLCQVPPLPYARTVPGVANRCAPITCSSNRWRRC